MAQAAEPMRGDTCTVQCRVSGGPGSGIGIQSRHVRGAAWHCLVRAMHGSSTIAWFMASVTAQNVLLQRSICHCPCVLHCMGTTELLFRCISQAGRPCRHMVPSMLHPAALPHVTMAAASWRVPSLPCYAPTPRPKPCRCPIVPQVAAQAAAGRRVPALRAVSLGSAQRWPVRINPHRPKPDACAGHTLMLVQRINARCKAHVRCHGRMHLMACLLHAQLQAEVHCMEYPKAQPMAVKCSLLLSVSQVIPYIIYDSVCPAAACYAGHVSRQCRMPRDSSCWSDEIRTVPVETAIASRLATFQMH